MFQNMLQSMVLNESVYMPLLHLAFPMNVDGRKLFSEMWIDPDEEGSSTQAGAKHTTRIFVKFDIRELGQFKLLLFMGTMRLHFSFIIRKRCKNQRAIFIKRLKISLTGIISGQTAFTSRQGADPPPR
uniref:hypothetical protein n=1 Tax=Clostridium sp. NkU-1 TaxID=1095009 RepID=UPI0006D2C793